MVANLDLFHLPCLVQADPTMSSVALIIRTKVTYISRPQVSGCLQLSPFPLSVCLSVRHFIVKKSCDNISTGYETFLRYLFVLRLRSINYRVVIMPNPAKQLKHEFINLWILTLSRGQDVSTRSWYTQDSVLQNLKFYPQGFVKKRYVDFIYRVCSL